LPFVGEGVDDVDEGGIEVWLWGQAWGVEPCVPVQLGEKLGGLCVGAEEVEDCGLELVGVQGLALEDGEVLWKC
jgi:hypothetical protein